ncbi:hypothetical protein L1049_024627 [Liquidambar formosana]|uniref:Uncharacterized protein n=1 Tax=Liquidambar formosana TaxID=63359 RepID=A0AAP0RWD4_LIQFO
MSDTSQSSPTTAGIVTGMTIPPIYVKYEDKIKSYEEGMKVQWGRLCEMVDEKVLKKMKSKIVEVKEDKKVE